MTQKNILDLYGNYGLDGVNHIWVPKTWVAKHHPGVNLQATATKAASTHTGQRNVATSITVTFCAGASAPAAVVLTVALIDGASGGTNYLWGPHDISLPAVAGAMNGIALPLWVVGTAGTAMTLEFSGPGGANTFESVTLEGTLV